MRWTTCVRSVANCNFHFRIFPIYRPLDIPVEAQRLASDKKFELKAYAFGAAKEQIRAPRPVKIGLVQNKIVRPTTDPIVEQV